MYEWYIAGIVFCAAYGFFILSSFWGWIRKRHCTPSGKQPYVTVIVPARNEESVISACLESISKQDYPEENIEIFLADDHSEDQTVALAEKVFREHPSIRSRILKAEENVFSKKPALEHGVRMASGEIILVTDADCRVPSGWIRSMVSCFQPGVHFVAGPVAFENNRSLFGAAQSLEFAGLMAIAAAGIRNNLPVMCNGASMAFRKKIFLEVEGFSGNKGIATGDDTQLMMKIHVKYRNAIRYATPKASVVITGVSHTLSQFISQRRRWASKIPFALSGFTISFAAAAWLAHTWLFVSSVFVLAGIAGIHLLILPVVLKVLPEALLLISATGYIQRRQLLWLFLPLQPLYMIYITLTGLLAPMGTFRWKGRVTR
ncbi:MAG: glycosyltransferase [Bacteroidia bacterium]|nr:glycosyltransferase [Bacteroidia bacterium]